MVDFLYNLAVFIISLSVLVTIHECGHFFVARACKVRILRFSIGFGNVLFRTVGKDGCEYVISALPLGGYVKMLGENDPLPDDGTIDNREDSFAAKSRLQRALIIGAGPACNILLALVLYVMVFMLGTDVLRPVIGDVMPNNGLAKDTALAPMDEIKRVNGKEVTSWSDVLLAVVDSAGSDVRLSVVAEMGAGPAKEIVLGLHDLKLTPKMSLLDYLGIRPCHGRVLNEVDLVQKDSPAEKHGIQKGDRIISIDGNKMENFYRVSDYIRENGYRPLKLVIDRQGRLYESTVTPDPILDRDGAVRGYRIGVGAKTESIDGLHSFVSYSFLEALYRGTIQTYDMSLLIVRQIGKMIDGSISVDNISGPITIARGAGESAQLGFTFYLGFLALISVNLGILNLLPIPVLDGGQLLFIAYEAVFRRKPNASAQMYLTVFGMTLLVLLTLFALFNDIKAL